MFKKLTSLLFKEEEIIIEEEIAKQEKEDVRIPNLKPIRTPEPEYVKPVQPEKKKVEEVAEEKVVEEVVERKAVMITADDHLEVREIKTKTTRQPIKDQSFYQSQDIISPIFGGSQKSSEPLKKTVTDAKRRTPVTQVISPMYGRVEVETDQNDAPVSEAMMDLDITEMLSPDRTDEEVQVSLYDYLEGLENDE